METKLAKRRVRVFGKDNYLLGQDEQGINYWLEAPSWDCGWYWAMGYIETYTNNRKPEQSRDINSHEHWSGLVGQQTKYDWDKKVYVNDKYVYHINESPRFVKTVLTNKESWELSDLMKRFYALKDMAEILHHGTANLTSDTKHKTLNNEFRKWINETELPALFQRVIEILEPKEGGTND